MGWNHRVMKREYGPDAMPETGYEIHEVYCNDDGKIWGWTEEPTDMAGESLDGLRQMLERMMKALDEPVLDYNMEPEVEPDWDGDD